MDVEKRLELLKYEDGFGTLTGKGLEFVASSVLNKRGYQGDRIDVPDVIILITDGKSSDNPERISMTLHDRHIKIITVGVGPKSYEPQLHRIASPPVEKNTFKFKTYKDLNGQENVRKIAYRIREECYLAKGWSRWSEWGECSTTCGRGTMIRRRRCHHADEGAVGCEGSWKETETCNIQKPCPEIPEARVSDTPQVPDENAYKSPDPYDNFDESGSSEIDEAEKPSSPVVLSPKLPDVQLRTAEKPVSWTYVSECSVPCGGGTRQRENMFNKKLETEFCNTQQCPKEWSDWSSWSKCSATCGSGSQFKSRTCLKTNATANIDFTCPGDAEKIRICEMGGCPYYTQWEDWSACSVTCGEYSERTRIRICKNNFNGDCDGGNTEIEECSGMKPCPFWSDWVEWSQIGCSTQCGLGSKTRERECINGQPRLDCPGIHEEIIDCNQGPCQEWMPWSAAGECSVTCGIGTKIRQRECINGICPDGEQCCLGDSEKILPCRGLPCINQPLPRFSELTTAVSPVTTQITPERQSTQSLLTTTAAVSITSSDESLNVASKELSLEEVSSKIWEEIFTSTDCEIVDPNVLLQCYGNECAVGCKAGYRKVGDDVMFCDGEFWNVTQPQCAPLCTDEIDLILTIPSEITPDEMVYARTFIKKIIALFTISDSDAKVRPY